jgi:hypothetical protein
MKTFMSVILLLAMASLSNYRDAPRQKACQEITL